MSTIGLSLDVYFRKQTYPSFPHFKSSFGWSSYNLKDLSINLFGDFRSAQLYSNLKAYIGAPDYTDEEIQAYLDKAIHGVYYINKDNNDTYDKETETKLADIRLFISPDGAFLLKAHQALKNNIKKDEIAIFLEIPDKDIVSGNVMAVVAGDNAKKYAEEILQHKWTQEQYSLNDAQTKDLISALNTGQSLWDMVNSIALEFKHTVKDLRSQIIIDVAGAISKFFGETLRVDERIWNIDHPEYLLQNDLLEKIKEKQQEAIAFFDSMGLDSEYQKVLNGLLEKGIRKIENSEISMQESWASRCGFWNGLVDLISGIFDLIQLLNKGIKTHRNYKNNSIYYNALMLEYIDNFLQAAMEIKWEEVLSHGLVKYNEFKAYFSERLTLEYWQELLSFNHTEIAYYRGYLAFNILETIIPPIKLAKLAKVGKLEKVISLLDGLTTSAAKTGVPAVKASDEVVGAFFRTIEQGTEVVKGGTENVNKLTDEVFDALKKQIDETVEDTSKLTDDVIHAAKLKKAKELWDMFTYEELMKTPPVIKPCFLKGTLVTTENGAVPIEDICTGMLVHSYNFESRQTEWKPVTRTYKSVTEQYLRITTATDTVSATGQHRFWIPKMEQWVMANSLKEDMKLLNASGLPVPIQTLEIVSETTDTYNLEVEDHQNYYVGRDEVLTHNKTRISRFASTELIEVEFYKILDSKMEAMYVGQTTQGYDTRYTQHRGDPKKASWRNKMKGVFEIEINDMSGPFKMTHYEAAVTELYEINYHKGISKSAEGLFNKSKPIGQKKFDQFKKLGTFNPCKFYV